MKYKNYNTKTMPDNLLWQASLTPIENRMPVPLKKFLKACDKEFFKRNVKMKPVMDCSGPCYPAK